jgi:6-pyruvoyltetrahydropterin/6-carboxytetrahydropterin synthase
MTISVFRESHFNAAHRLHNSSWSDEKNQEVFGLCNNPNYHGHNYRITVKVTGQIDPETGFVIDTKILGRLLKEQIENQFDHKNLNLDVPEFASLNPTAENIAVVAWNKLRPLIPSHLELAIILHETERNFVEYAGN